VRRAARRQKGSEAQPVDEFPDDLEGETLKLARELLYARLADPATVAEISTHTLAKIVIDLSKLELAKGVPPDQLIREKQVNVLHMVSGLPPERALHVLKAALPDAEDPEPIRRAIRDLEAGNGSPRSPE
jgi:hypothetical protein